MKQLPASNKQTYIKMKKSTFRFIVVFLMLLAIFTFTMMISAFAKPATDGLIEPAKEPVKRVVYVQPGDTLWGIAEQYGTKGMDVRKYIYMIKKENQLETAALKAGQRLILP